MHIQCNRRESNSHFRSKFRSEAHTYEYSNRFLCYICIQWSDNVNWDTLSYCGSEIYTFIDDLATISFAIATCCRRATKWPIQKFTVKFPSKFDLLYLSYVIEQQQSLIAIIYVIYVFFFSILCCEWVICADVSVLVENTGKCAIIQFDNRFRSANLINIKTFHSKDLA